MLHSLSLALTMVVTRPLFTFSVAPPAIFSPDEERSRDETQAAHEPQSLREEQAAHVPLVLDEPQALLALLVPDEPQALLALQFPCLTQWTCEAR